jgi:hypothetical protein
MFNGLLNGWISHTIFQSLTLRISNLLAPIDLMSLRLLLTSQLSRNGKFMLFNLRTQFGCPMKAKLN